MADSYNTSDSAREPVPTFPSLIPGAKNRVTWSEYLALMAVVVDQIDSGEPGHFIGNYLLGLSKQARIFGAVSPADHTAKGCAAADHQAAYIAALEQVAECSGTWALGPDPDLGSWGGHPDEATMQAYIAIDPSDETWRN